jgi:dipeptidyl aminopeptidase/acylaminoacyl peptidase
VKLSRWAFFLFLAGTAGCGLLRAGDDAGVDFRLLFAPPTEGEIRSVLEEWQRRDVSAAAVTVVLEEVFSVAGWTGILRVVSHRVGGRTHYGAVISPPDDGTERPVLVMLHGSDSGVSIEGDVVPLYALAPDVRSGFVVVVPSFRSEPLRLRDRSFQSEGPASPWDGDVDDALALLEAALAVTPQADPARVAALGFSRGATVALLMAVRDERIGRVVEFFGATDFFSPFSQEIVREALEGRLRPLPGLEHLHRAFIQPLNEGEISIDDVRIELLRRSPVYFAARLPALQLDHGTADHVVPVTEAEALIRVLEPRSVPEFEPYLYPGGGHHPLTLEGSIPRTLDFLLRMLEPAIGAVRLSPRALEHDVIRQPL